MANAENSASSGLGATGGATLDRPGTTQRSGGRVAMTVLRQQQEQVATALPPLASTSTAQPAQQGAGALVQPGAAPASPRRSLVGAKQVGMLCAGFVTPDR